jgi:hypothetical protein
LRQEGLLFLKKKKQKDFCSIGLGVAIRSESSGQKFFASFFQKRSSFLVPALAKPRA